MQHPTPHHFTSSPRPSPPAGPAAWMRHLALHFREESPTWLWWLGSLPPGTQKLLSVSVARDSTHPTRSPSLFFGRTEPGWAASPPPIRWQARQRGRRGGGFGAWRPFSNNARLFSKRPSRIFDDAPHLGRWKGYRGRNGGLSEGARRCIQAAWHSPPQGEGPTPPPCQKRDEALIKKVRGGAGGRAGWGWGWGCWSSHRPVNRGADKKACRG